LIQVEEDEEDESAQVSTKTLS